MGYNKYDENEEYCMFLALAILSAYDGIEKKEGGPFGACIVKNNEIITIAHNKVLKNNCAIYHAEMEAIRLASEKLGTWNLKGCKIYSTTEPCPMCFSAIHWAQIDEVIYGTSISDVKALGFNELTISSEIMKEIGKSPVKIKKDFMREDCLKLLDDWSLTKGQLY